MFMCIALRVLIGGSVKRVLATLGMTHDVVVCSQGVKYRRL